MKSETNRVRSLPFYIPDTNISFNCGMRRNAPFIVTGHLQRSDLGDCIISTAAPYFVAKIRSFKTCPAYREGSDAFNEKQRSIAEKNESRRYAYFSTREQAALLSKAAEHYGFSVKELIENPPQGYYEELPRTYDEEFDEPRIIAKIPGLNAYLELLGCLDDIPAEEVQWDGPGGVFDTLARMSAWAQNVWPREGRRPLASRASDIQLMPEWCEDYDETAKPDMAPKRGVGVWPYIDTSRRPEYQHSRAPRFANDDIEAERLRRARIIEEDRIGRKRE